MLDVHSFEGLGSRAVTSFALCILLRAHIVFHASAREHWIKSSRTNQTILSFPLFTVLSHACLRNRERRVRRCEIKILSSSLFHSYLYTFIVEMSIWYDIIPKGTL